MATNRHAMIRYRALDRCFSNQYKEYCIEDLIEACNDAIYEFDGTDGVSRRTIFNDISYMKSDQGWTAPIEKYFNGKKPYYRYSDNDFSINNVPLSQNEILQLKETIMMLGRFKGMPWIEEFHSILEDKFHLKGNKSDVIGLEQNRYLKGIEHLPVLFNYIVNERVLVIKYESFRKSKKEYVLHPYYLKQYNNRWFLFGFTEMYGITNLALDRIADIIPSNEVYIKNKEINFDEYFDDVIGVTIPKDTEPQIVRLRFSDNRFPYVTSKPLHPSQKIVDLKSGLIELFVVPNRELVSLLLSFGNDVEVVENDELRKVLAENIRNMYEKYFDVQNSCTL